MEANEITAKGCTNVALSHNYTKDVFKNILNYIWKMACEGSFCEQIELSSSVESDSKLYLDYIFFEDSSYKVEIFSENLKKLFEKKGFCVNLMGNSLTHSFVKVVMCISWHPIEEED